MSAPELEQMWKPSGDCGSARSAELLAPAGDWECARAAVENGADAIYFGLEKFNARMRAQNFTELDLRPLMEFLHRRGVRGYVTFNTLVFENELVDAEQRLRTIIAAGVDAAIVQDVGICRLIRKLSPDFPIHASTQMTITSAAGVEFARELGCSLVVLARENSIRDIQQIRSELQRLELERRSSGGASNGDITKDENDRPEIPLEVFVHGALCVAYSGQCLTSEALGGRSANRGECAQACRMPYELISDGRVVLLGERRYLLSPQDLAGLDVLPELVIAGVASLKIEGRLKTPEYVANITRIYRQALDRLADSELRDSSFRRDQRAGPADPVINVQESCYEMQMAFSRGLYTGWLRGIDNQKLVHAQFGKKRGVFLGEVTRVKGRQVFVKLQGPIKSGDGVVFDAGHPDQPEQGGRVYQIKKPEAESTTQRAHEISTGEVILTFGNEDIDPTRIEPGNRIWKTSDPEIDRRLRQTFAGAEPRFQRAVHFEVDGRAGEPLTIVARDDLGNVVRLDSSVLLSAAERQPLGTERLREQLGRLGGTPFTLGRLDNSIKGNVILPVSELNRLRREAVAGLEQLRARPKAWTLRTSESGPEWNTQSPDGRTQSQAPELIVLARTLPQLEAALQAGIASVYCEFENPKKYREAVQLVRAKSERVHTASSVPNRPSVFVAPPRIYKPGEQWILRQVLSCEADGYLVRNYDHLKFFSGRRCIGDFSLNVANSITADYLKTTFLLERLTASYDLNIGQLEKLLRAAPSGTFEVTIHQHMPLFHMEHCVFCAFLSKGKDYTDCGRPCDKHTVRLRDRVGAEHFLRADAGCRNTLFNAVAQTGAEYVKRLLAAGLRHFRVEFLNEDRGQVITILSQYGRLLEGQIDGAQLWRSLRLVNQLGVTRGTLDQR
jgi:putative protease